ncbi:MAG: conjugative coupling factor TraD, PFGI-1 class, partial [Gammaproteobacteria bacterium]
MASEVFDNRLRPAIEFLPAVVLGVGGAVLVAAPGPFFPLMPGLATLVAAVFLALAGWRFYQGCQILRYRRRLKRLPRYVLDAEAIPFSHQKLFLGCGFPWDQRHSQRLIEARSPSGRRYLESGRLHRAARALELRFEHTPVLAHLARLTGCDAGLNPLRPLPP